MRNNNPFSSLIGTSPFRPLQQHMRVVSECVDEMPKLFESLTANDEDSLNASKTLILQKEKAASVIKTELRGHLPKSLFMPVDRRDLLDLLESQHSIAESVCTIARLLSERDMPVPDAMKDELLAFVKGCMRTFQQTVSVIEKMDELVEVGFRGLQAEKVDDMVSEVEILEDSTEVLRSQLNKKLFTLEDQLSPVSVMLWYQLGQWLLDISIRSEGTSDRVRLMLAR